MTLQHRNLLCRLAIADSSWLDVVPWGLASSQDVANRVQAGVNERWPQEHLVVLEMSGADYAAKYSLWSFGRPFVCIGRDPDTQAIEEGMRRDRTDVHEDFILIREGPGDVSSTNIRRFLQEKDWPGLRAAELLSLSVCNYLERMAERVYHANKKGIGALRR